MNWKSQVLGVSEICTPKQSLGTRKNRLRYLTTSHFPLLPFLLISAQPVMAADPDVTTNVVIYSLSGNGGVVTNGNLGGRAGADASCAASAAKPITNATALTQYHAFISVDANDEIQDMPANYSLPTDLPIVGNYTTTTPIATNWTNLLNGTALLNTMQIATGATNEGYWTGSNGDGSVSTSQGTCNGWTSNSSAVTGDVGTHNSTTSPNWLNGGWAGFTCDHTYNLLCIAFTPSTPPAITPEPEKPQPCTTCLEPLPLTMNLKVDFGGNGTGSLKVQNGKNYPGTDSTLGTCKNGDDCYFPNLETATWVKMVPQADAGSEFHGWGGSTYCRDGNPFMISNVSCIAYFSTLQAPHYPLSVTKTGTGEGTITSVNPGIDCGTTCANNFDSTVEVELSAVPSANSQFIGWSGDCSGNSSHTHLKVTQAKTCTAQFDLLPPPPPNQYPLTITKTGDGNGTIISPYHKINCGDICNSNFDENSEVTLIATADPDTQFIEWKGDCASLDNPIKVTMTVAKSCEAVFDPKQLPPVPPLTVVSEKLSVEKHGNGLGQVITDPAGLTLHFDDTTGAEATADYVKGSTVKLLVETQEGTTFTGFEGDPDCADSVVTMDVSKHCLAHFEQEQQPPPVTPPTTEPPPVTPPTTEQLPVVIAPPPQQPERLPISDLPPVNNETCPTNRHYTIHLDEDCNAEGRTIENLRIVRGGSLANAVVPGTITSEEGLVANTTIESTGILEGGSVTSFIINKGLMKNFKLRGAKIQGGRLAGKITIASFVINEIRDVTLEAETVIQGKTGTVVQGVLTEEYVAGKLVGKVTGDATNPALIEGVIITTGTQLDNVILGKNVILEDEVILGENVTFADGSQQEPAVCEPNALGLDNKGNEAHDLKACFTLQPGKEHVEISVQVDPAHVGQKADLLFVIKASSTEWYTLDKTTWKTWNGNLDSLKVKESFKKLPETIVLEFSNTEFNELGSELTLFVGYQLPDGTIVYNSGESL